MRRYNPSEIEPRWQKKWLESGIYAVVDFDTKRPKFVMLTEFPYPSGDGLHLGHVREYTLGDVIARYKRMTGHNVLYPMGYDAFGLPTENYAIKHKVSPQSATDTNVSNFQKQFESLGYSIDWDRSFRTSDPDYYKWTQWLFLRFFKRGLAYQDEIDINWCPKCKTGLANEEVVNGRHERCGTLVEKKTLKQWLLKITDYADRLIDGLETVDYPPRIADQQINWIGRSQGANIRFTVAETDKEIEVFTTRPDTIFGASFIVLAPENPLVQHITTDERKAEVQAYVSASGRKSDIERQDTKREKSGVFTGSYAKNPANGALLPVWVADYVLMGYGTGAIMAVPAHDERDGEFARTHKLPFISVIEPEFGTKQGDEVEKDAIVAVVYNPKDKTYLMLDWGPRRDRWGGQLFIGGGMDENEDPVACARREIAEETGYTHVKHIQTLDTVAHSYYFSNVKNKNYYARMHGLLFELTDDTKQPVELDEGEKNKFKPVWVSEAEASKRVDDGGHRFIYESLVHNYVHTGEGRLVHSGQYNGMSSSEAREQIVADLAKSSKADAVTHYRLRDWVFSRQHYWGEPIPIIHCPSCGPVAVPDKDLPVELPMVAKYEPTDTGESPLASIKDWVVAACPKCQAQGERETDTMPNWAGSSWYYLRYFDAHNSSEFAARDKLDYWGEVDLYLGGMEHTTLHLLYSRFWHQFFYDEGLVPTPEPYAARRGQGIVLAADGTKMSKSKGNVVNPSEIINQGYGADALRVSIAFLAPYDQTTPWNPEGVAGTHRFLNRVWTLLHEYNDRKDEPSKDVSADIRVAQHRTVKKVSADLESMAFNTAVASLMEYVNDLYKLKVLDAYQSPAWKEALDVLVTLLAPFAPHVAEELAETILHLKDIHTAGWPVHNEKFLVSSVAKVVVQVNGKVRATVEVPKDSDEPTVASIASSNERVAEYLHQKKIQKIIYVKNRLINFVV